MLAAVACPPSCCPVARTAGPRQVSPRQVGPRRVGRRQMGPTQVGSQAGRPQMSGPQAGGPQAGRPQGGGPQALLLLLGDDQVSQHVEGVAIGMHSHHVAILLLDLKEARVIQANYPHFRPLDASQADPLATGHENSRVSEKGNAVSRDR